MKDLLQMAATLPQTLRVSIGANIGATVWIIVGGTRRNMTRRTSQT